MSRHLGICLNFHDSSRREGGYPRRLPTDSITLLTSNNFSANVVKNSLEYSNLNITLVKSAVSQIFSAYHDFWLSCAEKKDNLPTGRKGTAPPPPRSRQVSIRTLGTLCRCVVGGLGRPLPPPTVRRERHPGRRRLRRRQLAVLDAKSRGNLRIQICYMFTKFANCSRARVRLYRSRFLQATFRFSSFFFFNIEKSCTLCGNMCDNLWRLADLPRAPERARGGARAVLATARRRGHEEKLPNPRNRQARARRHERRSLLEPRLPR